MCKRKVVRAWADVVERRRAGVEFRIVSERNSGVNVQHVGNKSDNGSCQSVGLFGNCLTG